ncbi:unnamed protein product [Boreogadus saida]
MGIGITRGGETAEESEWTNATYPINTGTLPHRTEREKPGTIPTPTSAADRAGRTLTFFPHCGSNLESDESTASDSLVSCCILNPGHRGAVVPPLVVCLMQVK